MAPKGMKSAVKAKAAAAADGTQQVLKWVLRSSPQKEKAPMPKELPSAQKPEKARKLFATKVSSTRDTPQISEDAARDLEVNAIVHEMIDRIVAEYEKEETSCALEVHSWLNAAIDFVAFNFKPPKEDAIAAVQAKRSSYTTKQKEAVIAAVDASNETVRKKAIARLNLVSGYEKVTATMLEKWKKASAPRKQGVKVNTEFETQVLSQLVYTELEKVNDVEQAVVKANVAHSHAVIKKAAETVQKMPAFTSDEKVKKLAFSPMWVRGFLRRAALRRRRVTATEKVLPPVEEVRGRMTEIQKVKVDGDYKDDETISADETGVFFGAPPKNQYIPESAVRATAAESDDKARFTSLLWGDGEGNMGPSFNIVKMSVKGPDLSSSRVLDNMMAVPGFTTADGWEKRIWRRKLKLPNRKKELITQEYVRPYLIHVASGIVITVQQKAWMDTAGICMWIDVQIGPHFAKKRGKGLIVWDNCGPHKVEAVHNVMKEWGLRAEELPPRMTDILQVMDLIVNGPIKAGIRRARIEDLFSYIQSWKIARLQHAAQKDGTLPPEFKPPKPSQAKGLLILFKVIKENLETQAFKKSMKLCFQHVGLTKGPGGEFAVYHASRKGVLTQTIPQVNYSDDAVSVGEVASELALTRRSSVSKVVATKVIAPGKGKGNAPGAAGSSAEPAMATLVEESDFTEDESDAHTSDDDE